MAQRDTLYTAQHSTAQHSTAQHSTGDITAQKKINVNFSILRIFATLGVVFLHTCSTIISHPEIFDISESQKTFLQIGRHLFDFAVPVFFMITGRLLLSSNKEINYKITFTKYIRRIFLALLIFSLGFSIIKIFVESHTFSLLLMLKAFVVNDSFSHLWYLYYLIGLYLIIPILKPAIKSVKMTTVFIFVVVLFITNFIFNDIKLLFGMNIAFDVPITYPVFYFLAGYLVSNSKFKFLNNTFFILATTIIITIAVIVCSIFIDKQAFVGYYQSTIIGIYSVCIYTLFDRIARYNFKRKAINIIWKIDRLCFGVYLIHPLFIQFTYKFLKITPCDFNLYILMTFVFFIAFAVCSFIISYIMNLIPFARKYIL